MPISLYDATIPSFLQTLGAVDGFLAKGLAYCAEHKIDLATIVETRIYPDMNPFRYQIFSVVSHSLGAIEGVRRGSFSPIPATELDYNGLQKKVSDARASLEAVSTDEVNGFVGRDMKFVFGERSIPFSAEDFLLSFSLPNFHFHASIAYGILRSKGVPLGKRDFLGRLRIKSV